MNKPHRRRATDRIHWNPIVLAFIILTIIFFGTSIGFAWIVHDVNDNSNQLAILVSENRKLLKENDNRIKDIQIARIQSCVKTYEGIHEVFREFFPPEPRTPQQLNEIEKFNETINRLQRGCVKQTGQG